MPDGSPRSGISSYDVERLARNICREHGGHVHWVLALPVRQDTGVALTVRAVFVRERGGADAGVFERGCSGRFPGGDGRTLTGELYKLTWELYIKLDEERDQAERATQGRFA